MKKQERITILKYEKDLTYKCILCNHRPFSRKASLINHLEHASNQVIKNKDYYDYLTRVKSRYFNKLNDERKKFKNKTRRVRGATPEGDAMIEDGTANEIKSQVGQISKQNLAVQAERKDASAAYEAKQDKDQRTTKQLNDKAKQITQTTLKIIKKEWKPHETLYHAASSLLRSLVRKRCLITNEPLYHSGFEPWEWILRLSCRIKWKATGDTLTGNNLKELISKGWARLIIFNDPKVNSDTSAYVLHEVEKGVQREILSSERDDDVMNTIAGAGKSRQGEAHSLAFVNSRCPLLIIGKKTSRHVSSIKKGLSQNDRDAIGREQLLSIESPLLTTVKDKFDRWGIPFQDVYKLEKTATRKHPNHRGAQCLMIVTGGSFLCYGRNWREQEWVRFVGWEFEDTAPGQACGKKKKTIFIFYIVLIISLSN